MHRKNTGAAADLTQPTFRAFLHSFGLLRQVMESFFAPHGISGPQWGILRVLHNARLAGENGLRLTDVGDRMFIQPPSVTGAVDRLERRGLLKRSGSKDDLRVRLVSLTPAGWELVEKLLGSHREKVNSLFAALTPQELEDLHASLHKLEAHWSALAPRSPT